MDSPQFMLSLLKAKDPAALSQKKATILDVVKKSSTAGQVKFSDAVAM